MFAGPQIASELSTIILEICNYDGHRQRNRQHTTNSTEATNNLPDVGLRYLVSISQRLHGSQAVPECIRYAGEHGVASLLCVVYTTGEQYHGQKDEEQEHEELTHRRTQRFSQYLEGIWVSGEFEDAEYADDADETYGADRWESGDVVGVDEDG